MRMSRIAFVKSYLEANKAPSRSAPYVPENSVMVSVGEERLKLLNEFIGVPRK